MSTETASEPSTEQRVLAAAVGIARRDGIEAVTHKGVAAVTGLSSSNVTYYFGKAVALRRAVAVEIVKQLHQSLTGAVAWHDIEACVSDMLAEDRPSGAVTAVIYPSDDDIAAAEAYVWLARNGVDE